MRKKLLILFMTSLCVITSFAQDVSFDVQYPSVVRVGQQFNVTWTVNVSGGDFEAPSSFDGFTKLMGPQTSYSSSTQIINGKVTKSTSNSYTFVFQAQQEGTFEISPATFTYKKDTYKSKSIKIEVTANSNAASSSSTQTSRSNASSSGSSASNTSNPDVSGDIYLELAVNKREVYVGEPIAATAKIYTTANLSGINDVSFPSFTGFLKTDLETPQLTSLTSENINGVNYGTGVLQYFLLYPQVSGDLTIEPMSATVMQQQRVSGGRGSGFGSIFDDFFGSAFDDFFGSFQNVPINVSSKPVTIKVKPLPANKPADFSGIVGNVSISSSIDKDTVNVNDAVTLQITVSGSGNIRLASNPNLSMSPDVEVYDPKITDNLNSNAGGTTGSRVFEYLLIPRHYGDYVIPAVSYSYFNPSTGNYETISTQEYHFYANKTDDSQTPTLYGGVSKEDVKYLGQDIHFIKSKQGKLLKPNKLLAENKGFYSIYAFALLAFFAVLFVRREHVRRNADMVAVRNRKAGKVATQRLKVAAECMQQGAVDRTYEEILKALWGYLGDKLSIPVSSLNRNNIAETLRQKCVQDEHIDELTGIIDVCEFARYSPSASESEASDVYEKAASFIKFLENTIG